MRTVQTQPIGSQHHPGLSRSSMVTFAAWSVVLLVKNPPANAGDIRHTGRSLGGKDPLKEETATYLFLPGDSHGQRDMEGYFVCWT